MIYIDGDHSGGDSKNDGRQRYVMVPGPGTWTKRLDSNPALSGGDTLASGIKGAYSRTGNETVYEWSIPLFDAFPQQRSEVKAGKLIGFDILIGDADGDEKANYVLWTPGASKSRNSDTYGHLYFLNDYGDLGNIKGVVTTEGAGSLQTGLLIDVYQGDHLITTAELDEEYRFHLDIHAGEFALKVRRGQGIKTSEEIPVMVTAGMELQASINVTPVDLPEALELSMARYKSLKGYRDTTEVQTRTIRPGSDNRRTSGYMIAYEKPNYIRIESNIESSMERELFSNGVKMVQYMESWKQYIEENAPSVISSSNLQRNESFVAKKIFLSKDPMADLLEGLEEAKEVGKESLDSIQTTIIELTLNASALEAMMVPRQVKTDIQVPVRLWIGDTDHLIHKMSYELDMEPMIEYLPEDQKTRMGTYFKGMKISFTETHSAIETDPGFHEKYFVFIPPEGTELVKRFEPPGRSTEEAVKIGNPAPEFTLKDTEGKEAKLADFRGKVVLLDFWATWCGPCIQAMPHIQAIAEIYKERDVVVLGINTWENDPSKVKPFLEEKKITYRILMDSKDEVVEKYGVLGIPTFFILDKEGIIRQSMTGMPADKKKIQQNLEEFLAKE
jgi:peroxiredoxin/outer membrane lipoprotein-sorting protein